MSPASSCCSAESSATRRVPRGLWKGRANGKSRPGLSLFPSDNDIHRPIKRRRSGSEATDNDSDSYYVVEYSEEEEDDMEVTEPVVTPDNQQAHDWADLKELFGQATDLYDKDDINEALPLLRGCIHECHRLSMLYSDPSILYFNQPAPRSASPEPIISPASKPVKKCTCTEPVTAFHALFGTALFLVGNIIASEPSLAVADEPVYPAFFYLAALDVFETGEALPSRTSGRGCAGPEDWRMAIVWGRTLLAVADEALSISQGRKTAPPPEPRYPDPASSPFAVIAMRRPPACRRITLSTPPNELLTLAMDQLTRGIFHSPRSQSTDAPADGTTRPFSRASELFTIARETLAIAERLATASERSRWATWADGVLQQMDMEGDTMREEWRGPVTRLRGQCWLTIGTAEMEDIEEMANENDWDEVLNSEEATDAREGLTRAIELFEKAAGRELGTSDEDEELSEEQRELQSFLAEAFLTLANLTKDEQEREKLYQRAETLGAGIEGMDVDDE
uniref:Uncharacterized protein n=1 Tax=Mycena chlorophos TaxID=658473 RepID=A0ABQ0LS94_MYCCL|nr:predicted protein [Mycena chlorophos]